MTRAGIAEKSPIVREVYGSRVYAKMSYPVHCGIFTELQTQDATYHFDRNGSLRRMKRCGSEWAHPHEWIKRSKGNDWIYYSTGGYNGVFEATGEYYLPNLSYPTNNLLGGNPFGYDEVQSLCDQWYSNLVTLKRRFSERNDLQQLLERFLRNSPEVLKNQAELLFSVLGDRVSVLPPDARHVDYDILPVNISRGCLYKCRFCKVKNRDRFKELSREEIATQMEGLRKIYADDLCNYNSVFLGEHDALQASSELIFQTIEMALELLELDKSYLDGWNIFMFGSVSSLLGCPEWFWKRLSEYNGSFYINIGLESADQATLDQIGKPLTVAQIHEGFHRMQEINDRFGNIEITGNFIMDDHLPDGHYPSIQQLIGDGLTRNRPKGSIYFSPLTFNQPSRKKIFDFNRLKVMSRLPTYLYIIQRL